MPLLMGWMVNYILHHPETKFMEHIKNVTHKWNALQMCLSPRYSVCTGSTAMWPNNNDNNIKIVSTHHLIMGRYRIWEGDSSAALSNRSPLSSYGSRGKAQ